MCHIMNPYKEKTMFVNHLNSETNLQTLEHYYTINPKYKTLLIMSTSNNLPKTSRKQMIIV